MSFTTLINREIEYIEHNYSSDASSVWTNPQMLLRRGHRCRVTWGVQVVWWRERCRAGYSITGGPPLPWKRAPCQKSPFLKGHFHNVWVKWAVDKIGSVSEWTIRKIIQLPNIVPLSKLIHLRRCTRQKQMGLSRKIGKLGPNFLKYHPLRKTQFWLTLLWLGDILL